MPTYDYRCDANDRVVEVKHRMSEELKTWGELCAHSGEALGDTPADAAVRRLPTGGQLVKSSSLGDAAAPACSTGSCCPGNICGLN